MDYIAFSKFVIRSPRLPLDSLEEILYNRNTLLEYLQFPFIQDAIRVASPILFKELQKFLSGQIRSEKVTENILNSCARYISRMSTRCTPFGLFAGCGIGEIGEKSCISDESISYSVRLDMVYLAALFNAIVNIPDIKENIQYFSNNTLYKVGNKYRYIETLYVDSQSKYQIAEVERSYLLNKILKAAYEGVHIKKLTTILTDAYITEQEAVDFIDTLIDTQVIIPEMSNAITGDDFLLRIIRLLKKMNLSKENEILLKNLIKISTLLKDVNTKRSFIDMFDKILLIVKDIGVPFDEKYLIQVDMKKDYSIALLSNRIVEEVERAMVFLNIITPSTRNEVLEKFQQDFYKRYEDKEVPLMEVLDPEMGIGYPLNQNYSLDPLIDDLILPKQISQKRSEEEIYQSIFQKIIQNLTKDKKEIIFTDEDLKGLEFIWSDLPPTFCSMFEVLRTNQEDPLVYLKSCGGNSAAYLLGRFAYMDKNIADLVDEIVIKESEICRDSVIAEIVHSPDVRVGNILSRPHIRDFEILYLSESDLPRERLIFLSDLTLSIKGTELILRSKKLDKEIIPRLTTAHNYYLNTMPVYRFLCDMQSKMRRNFLSFNWGRLLEKEITFYPRVRYKNTILSLASWKFKIDQIKHFFIIKDDKVLIKEIKMWRKKYSIPQRILLVDMDNTLYVDLENSLSIQALFSIIKNRQEVKFDEFIFDPQDTIIKSKNRVYTNEFILAFHKKTQR